MIPKEPDDDWAMNIAEQLLDDFFAASQDLSFEDLRIAIAKLLRSVYDNGRLTTGIGKQHVFRQAQDGT